MRLTQLGRELGCVSDARWKHFTARRDMITVAMNTLNSYRLSATAWQKKGVVMSQDGTYKTAADVLFNPDMDVPRMQEILKSDGIDLDIHPRIREHIEVACRYAPHLAAQEREMQQFRSNDSIELPDNLDYTTIKSLSTEELQLLTKAQPKSLHAASRIPGIRAATLMTLFNVAKRHERQAQWEANRQQRLAHENVAAAQAQAQASGVDAAATH